MGGSELHSGVLKPRLRKIAVAWRAATILGGSPLAGAAARPAASALEAQPAAGASTLHTTLALSMDHFSAAGNLAERVWRRCTTACTPHRADRVCSARHGATTRPPPHALQTCAGAVAGEAGRIGTSRERVVARPLARQLSEEFKRACAPFQDALGTEAGADALVRAARVPWREA
ncbi:hypothetical protein AK812_SmicGene27386 [Symbiodinium microadriaticum]|uniref:Uncharacterized protein n=1 Tax=Symbiodinium microadriaticum TaxID=2951 RepID=A0A1Q9D789_SYMMI|nr:hypothetical protein AK812_SmicGene27386 [Symbiodinium microadriaticum]CAE7442579.1 unnamed protein product [Symbiodinium microadriaticum]